MREKSGIRESLKIHALYVLFHLILKSSQAGITIPIVQVRKESWWAAPKHTSTSANIILNSIGNDPWDYKMSEFGLFRKLAFLAADFFAQIFFCKYMN